ncbi:aromatic ring-hydroxylating dioxygenase subunit alpha [Nonomuraea sp. NPDC046570]|uniref:aromatic ring-hydroxylating oxygenase subunit alpha n=1 Tax=Nonomuraea sp. NPDC046570 TaxID=3155255 RepID=UPI0034119C1B
MSKRLLTELRRLADLPFEQGETMPPQLYLAPEIHDLELERVFHRDWLCVARGDQVAEPGDYLRFDLPGRPMVLTRDEDGELHALSRVCRHRFMDILPPETTPGQGRLERLTCPYHTWTYRLNGEFAGRLAGAPLMRSPVFDREACRLPTYRLMEWNGFVLLNLDPDAEPLDAELADLTATLRGYGLAAWETVDTMRWEGVPANWKVAVENGCENYHHMGTHATTLEPVLPARKTRVDDCDGRWFTMYTPAEGSVSSMPPAEGLSAEQRGGMTIAGIFPNFVMALTPDSVIWASWWPTGPHTHDTVFRLLVPPGTRSRPDFPAYLEETRKTVRHLQEEDLVAIRGVQRGLAADPAPPAGRFSYLERPLWQLQRYLAARLTPREA